MVPSTRKTSPRSLHDALPISLLAELSTARAVPIFGVNPSAISGPFIVVPATGSAPLRGGRRDHCRPRRHRRSGRDRESTPLNSSHLVLSYSVFCLIKKLFR